MLAVAVFSSSGYGTTLIDFLLYLYLTRHIIPFRIYLI